MDIDDATKQVDKADGFLTKLGDLLKKHWKLMTILAICYGVYWFAGQVADSMNDYNAKVKINSESLNIDASYGDSVPESTPDSIAPAPYIINTYIELKNGKDRTIEVWSDGVETVKPEE
jgi:hypothetical protein